MRKIDRLDAQQKEKVFILYMDEHIKSRCIATRYGVSTATINKIIRDRKAVLKQDSKTNLLLQK